MIQAAHGLTSPDPADSVSPPRGRQPLGGPDNPRHPVSAMLLNTYNASCAADVSLPCPPGRIGPDTMENVEALVVAHHNRSNRYRPVGLGRKGSGRARLSHRGKAA